ncbi:MAG: tRNA (guanosine(46)-N7)-methyltransferase TrmB [Bacteroidales bacterium]|nr:tRNA (guanosine(46)-N7)-methyltransferase TrmB [Bacteroidales bacterium]
MTKNKLARFAEIEGFSNVLQPPFEEVFQKDYLLKGKWKSTFFKSENPIILELGCGKGEYTVGLAKMFPGINFIGIDIKGARMWKGASLALKEGINNVTFLRTRIELIESFFEPDEIQEIWITFPDPQPKKAKKRLTSTRFLDLYRKFLVPGGNIHLKTDNKALYEYTLQLARYNKLAIITATSNLYADIQNDPILSIRTFYESQFLEQGLPIHYLKFNLKSSGILKEPPDVK